MQVSGSWQTLVGTEPLLGKAGPSLPPAGMLEPVIPAKQRWALECSTRSFPPEASWAGFPTAAWENLAGERSLGIKLGKNFPLVLQHPPQFTESRGWGVKVRGTHHNIWRSPVVSGANDQTYCSLPIHL